MTTPLPGAFATCPDCGHRLEALEGNDYLHPSTDVGCPFPCPNFPVLIGELVLEPGESPAFVDGALYIIGRDA